MRELKDYFCNYDQAQDLIKLGLSEKYGISAEQYETAEFGYSGFLRSQALDFFRRRYLWSEYSCNKVYFVVYINGTTKYFYTEKHKTYHEAESALIDKLIELEKEARNG